MRREIITWLAVACVSGSVWAGEPWKDKPSTSWTESDIQKILNDSPWSKTISIAATWLRKGAQGPEVGVKVSIPRLPRDPDHANDPDLKNPPDVHDQLYNQLARFQLRWESSRTIRTALRLKGVPQGAQKPTADASPTVDSPELEFLLIGDPLAPFPIATESELKANTVLRLKDTKQTLSPTRVTLLRRDDGQILEARFYFRKVTPGGHPMLPVGEKMIEFQCLVGGVNLRAKFEPARMIDSQGMDLR